MQHTKERRPTPRRVTFKVAAFQGMHRHLPRGNAFWIFRFSDSPDEPWLPRDAEQQLIHCGYLQAKAFANAEGVRRRCYTAVVDPHPL